MPESIEDESIDPDQEQESRTSLRKQAGLPELDPDALASAAAPKMLPLANHLLVFVYALLSKLNLLSGYGRELCRVSPASPADRWVKVVPGKADLQASRCQLKIRCSFKIV